MNDTASRSAEPQGASVIALRSLDRPEIDLRPRLDPTRIEPGTIAFVPPRYGPDVIGGAEAVLAEAAHGLAARGHRVEVLSTCARDHFTWANEYPAGSTDVDGAVVRRFPTETDSAGRHRDRIGGRILAGDTVSIQDQQLWANDSLRCSGLWDHMFTHGHRYRAVVFAPYMFWTTYAVSQVVPDRSIVMPCLHDEPPAHLDIFASMMEGAAGTWFLTDPERDLAERIYDLPDRIETVGASVELPTTYDPASFRHRFELDRPFVYFAGRREWGKGWNDLVDGFARHVHRRGGVGALTLATSGVGALDLPDTLTTPYPEAVVDLGLLTDDDRNNAMAAASAYVQPSAMESFSRTVLEAMAAGTPVVANGASDVVSWHVERSGAGLTYRTEAELVECLDFVADRADAFGTMAVGGRSYVERNYRLEGVLDRMERSLDDWFPPTDQSQWAEPAVPGGERKGRA